jgi:cell division transport system ATP-binding protein
LQDYYCVMYTWRMIAFEGIAKRYGRTKVLDHINLVIKNGEFVSVIGPSGAGKSTLVHLLIGAERPTTGKIVVDGFEVNKMNDKAMQYYRRRIGVVFQDFKLLKQKNVYENVAFALEVCGYEKDEIKKRVSDALRVVGLSKRARNFPHQLSGGEKQKTAIARALVHDPNLIIADEPTGNLDPLAAKDLIELLLEINKGGTTIILTTHNRDLVNFVNKRVVTLDEGRIIKDKKIAGYNS